MEIIDKIKAILSLVQKYNDIELNQRIVDLNQQVLSLSDENAALRTRIKQLENIQDIESRMLTNEEPYFTLKGDNPNIRFCTNCWNKSKIQIQLQCFDGKYRCPECRISGYYDKSKRYTPIFM